MLNKKVKMFFNTQNLSNKIKNNFIIKLNINSPKNVYRNNIFFNFIQFLVLFFLIFNNFENLKSQPRNQFNNTKNNNLNKIQPGNSILLGEIINKRDKTSIISAKVSLLNNKDSLIIAGTFTKSNGKFELKKIPLGTFLLKINALGFKETLSQPITFSLDTTIELNPIEIIEESILSQETVVEAKKQLIQVTSEGKLIDVQNNALATGGSVIDVLQNTPTVSVDFDGNISLRGSSSVNILIDGQPVSNSGGSRTALLDNIPASAVESIEIINNPGAKYNPEGTGGLLNIKLKKKQNFGLNGLVSLNVGTRDKYNGSMNFNWGLGKLNLFLSNDYRIDNRYREGTTNRLNTLIDSAAFLDQISDGTAKNISNNSRIGFDYIFNEKTNFNFSTNYNYRTSKRPEFLNSNEFALLNLNSTQRGDLTYGDISNISDNSVDNSLILASNFTQKMNNSKEIWTVDVNYSNNVSDDNETRNTQSNTEEYLFNFRSKTNNKSENLIFNSNYALPFEDNSKLEFGWNSNFRTTNSIFQPEFYRQDNMDWVSFDSLVNDFQYKEQIYAVYGSYNTKYEDFDFSSGLRIESANIQLFQKQNNKEDDIKYFSFFPTLGMKYNFTKTDAMNFNYSRRINRPNIRDLNPFVDIDNPRLISFGNTNVKPEYIDAMELGWSSFFETRSLIVSLFYRNVNNAIRRYNFLDSATGISNLSFANFDDSQFLGLEIIEDETLTNWWKLNTTLSFYHNRINGNAALGIFGNQNNSWNLKLNSIVNLWLGIDWQTFVSYSSPVATQQGEIKRFFFIDMALKKDITDDLNITFRVSDILNTLNFSVQSFGVGFESNVYRKRETRVGFLNISYKINSGIKPKDRQRPDSPGGMDLDM